MKQQKHNTTFVFRSLISSLTAILCVFSLIACGGGDSPAESSSSEVSTSAATVSADSGTTEVVTDESTTEKTTAATEATPVDPSAQTYAEALALLEDKKIEEAYDKFLEIKDYEDVPEYLKKFVFRHSSSVETESANPEEICEETLEYDEYGNRTKLTVSGEDGGTTVYDLEYDSNFNVIKETRTNPDGTCRVSLYEYDSEGRRTKETYYSEDKLESTCEYTYDSEGKMIKMFRDMMQYTVTSEYEHDSRGNVIKRTDVDTSSGLGGSVFEYNADNKMTKELITFSDGRNLTITYEYDENGYNAKTMSEYVTMVFECDSYGNVTKRTLTRKDGSVETIVFSDYKLYYNPANYMY